MTAGQIQLEGACQVCGKARSDAGEVVPEMAGWHVIHGLTGRWTCGDCIGRREGGEVGR